MENSQSALAMKYFLDNFSLDVMIDKDKPINKIEELARDYLTRLSEVFSVFDRVIRYEKYFLDFLPAEESGISESEAIEYHLRSYIQDFYVLQERVRKITERLIVDLKYYNISNKSDVEDALSHLSDEVHKKFKKITSGLRREHVHERSISELDLTIGKFLSSVISGEMPIPEGMILDPELLEKRRNEVLKSMKDKHVKQSFENSQSLKKMKEWFAARFIHIFSSLNGRVIEGLKMSIDD